jgi:hypothetical protein
MPRIADGGQGRQVGRVFALSTLSPVIRERRAKLDRALAPVRLFPPLGRPLAELAFIHYARWSVLDAVPAPDGSGARRQLASSYLLFESNYNGSLRDYLNAFTDVIPHRLAALWGNCLEFEETVVNADGADDDRLLPPWAFRSYVDRNELEVLHFHPAYPGATMIDVRQALAVAEERRRAPQRRGTDLQDAVRRTVPLVIGPTPPQPVGLLPVARDYAVAQWRVLSRRYGVNPFALMAPVDPAAANDQFERLRTWPEGEDRSPLRALTDTHYARLVRLPRDLMDLGQAVPDDLEAPYLLYTSNHRGSARDHVARLREQLGTVADDIWGHCPGYPGHDDPAFDGWAAGHTIDTRYFVAGYAPHEVGAVKDALALRERMAEQLWEDGPSPAWLRGDAA